MTLLLFMRFHAWNVMETKMKNSKLLKSQFFEAGRVFLIRKTSQTRSIQKKRATFGRNEKKNEPTENLWKSLVDPEKTVKLNASIGQTYNVKIYHKHYREHNYRQQREISTENTRY